jgi:hypothetical protein
VDDQQKIPATTLKRLTFASDFAHITTTSKERNFFFFLYYIEEEKREDDYHHGD